MDALTPAAFEAELDRALASGDLSPEDQADLAAARQRLLENPSLRRGDTPDAFTYSDEILERALYAHRIMEQSRPRIAGTRARR
jgi:hypothetical protein